MPAKDVFIVSAKRTAFGNFAGSLKDHTATDLAEHVATAALKSASIKPDKIDHVVFGNVAQSVKDAAYLARGVGLRVNIPHETPAITVNRLCGSGFESIIEAARQIIVGESKLVLAGGSESMSQSPFIARNLRLGVPLDMSADQRKVEPALRVPMALTAEKLGAKYEVTREETDKFTFQSLNRWRNAHNSGYFKEEIIPIKVNDPRKGEVMFDKDERAREMTLEKLSKIPPAFKKNGLITVASASGISDGAAASVIANSETVKELNLKPLVRLVGWKMVGCDPEIMGIGPANAIRELLSNCKLTLDDIDLIEVNEAFAAQVLSVQKELKLDNEKLNVNGGGVSIGHPLAASGGRILGHLAYELNRRKAKYAIGSACIGGGQGVAVLLERV